MKDSARRDSRLSPGQKPPARVRTARQEARTRDVPLEESSGGAAKDSAIAGLKERGEAALASVVFIGFPGDSLASLGLSRLRSLDPGEKEILLPVQMPSAVVKFDTSMISIESILSGILRVLAWRPSHKMADVYREIAQSLRPSLLAELSDAGIAKSQAKEWSIAEEIFLALTGLYPESPEPLLDLALLHEAHARLLREESREAEADAEDQLAFESYRALLTREPPFAPAYYHAAFFHMRTRNYDRAVSLFTSFIGLSDDEQKTAQAKEVLARLQELGYLDTTFKEAYDFIQMGEEEKGLEKARQFVGRFPAVWNGWFLVGWANRRLGRWEEGVTAFEKAIELGSLETDTWNELALCQIELGSLQAAWNSLERALRIEPENVKIIVNLGVLAHKSGRDGEALGFFRSALEIDPDDSLAKDWIEAVEGRAGA